MSAAPKGLNRDDRLVAILQAVGAPLPRAEIFERVQHDFDDEQELAKVLGQMVACGRLQRTKNARDQFVYQAAADEPAAAIAEAPTKMQTSAPSLDLDETAPPAEQTPVNRERRTTGRPDLPPMRRQILALFTAQGRWLKTREIAEGVGGGRRNIGQHLTLLVQEGALLARGSTHRRAYALAGSVAAPAPAAEPKAPKTKRVRNLAEFGVMPSDAPVPVPIQSPRPGVANEVTCAMEDSGLFAITDGNVTIRMSPSAIRKAVKFLELTQHVWQKAA